MKKMGRLPNGSYKLLKWKERGKVGFFWEKGTFKTFMVKGEFPKMLGPGYNLQVLVLPLSDDHHVVRNYNVTYDRIQ